MSAAMFACVTIRAADWAAARDFYATVLSELGVEAARHDNVCRGGTVDHVWMRVGDPTASRAFYAAWRRGSATGR